MPLFGGNRSISIKMLIDPKGAVAGIATVKKATGDFTRDLEKAATKHKRAFDDLGGAVTKVGLGLTAFAGVAVVSAANFDKSMSRAKAATQATSSELTALRQAALAAGKDTQYSATEAADGITEMAKAGVSTKDILGGGLRAALNLAAAGELSVADAASISATALTQFNLKGTDLYHVTDLLAAGAGKANGSVTDLSEALKYVGPVAHSLGMSIDQTVGTLAELAKQGIVGEQAGTSMRGMLLSLTAPSKAAKAEMDSLGISVFDAQGKFIGMDGAAKALNDGLHGMTDAQKTAALGTIFGNEQITAATILYKGGAKAVDDWTRKVQDNGYATRQAAELMNNLSGDVEQLKGSLETAFISGGSGATGGLRELTQGATAAVNAFSALPSGVQQSTVVMAGIAGASLLAAGGLVKVITTVSETKAAMTELGISTTKVKGALVGLGKGIAVLGAVSLASGFLPDIDQKFGAIGDGGSKMALELANFAKGADLAGDSAQVFGAHLKGMGNSFESPIVGTQGLAQAIDDLSGKNGWWNKDLPFLGSLESEQIGQYSKALAQLSQTDAPTAAQAFDRLTKEAGLNSDQVNRLLGLMPEYSSVLSGVAEKEVASGQAAAGSANAQTVLQEMLTKTGVVSKTAAQTLDELVAAIKGLYGTLTNQEAQDAFTSSLHQIKDAAKGANANLHGNSDATLSARDAMRSAVKQGLDWIATLKQNGASSKVVAAAARSAAAGIDATGRKAGLSKTATKEYSDVLRRVPKVVSTNVNVNTASATQKIHTWLSAWDRVQIAFGIAVKPGPRPSPLLPAKNAEGGYITGPGTGTSDSIPAMLSNGEFVIRSKQTARYRPLLEDINAGRRGFADGGFVASASTPYALSDVRSRYDATLPKPITAAEVTAAVNRAKNATIAADKAERDLATTRRKHPRDVNAIRDAEDRLDKARRAQTTARTAEAAAIARQRAPKGFNLPNYLTQLASTARATRGYRSDLATVAKRGGSQLAALLEAEGGGSADLVHALAKATPAQLAAALKAFRSINPAAFAATAASSTGQVFNFATGGLYGVPQAQIAPDGAYRVWAERGTGGEAYIPLGPGARARSRMVASDVVSRLGGTVAWSTARPSASVSALPSAAGGVSDRSGPLLQVGTIHQTSGSPQEVAHELMFELRKAGI